MMPLCRKSLWSLLLLLFVFSALDGQAPKRWTSGEIHDAIKKLNFLGSVLYVAAHPDDENTRLIAYLANEVKANTAYLSLTRGDGGQNLVGPEIRELLGLIRTQELLAARRTDGGTQLFTRANDFGFSKHPDETFQIWGKQDVLSDVVWAMRQWQPDVVINRFDHNSAGRTHGHHTASGILSVEAFDLAGDPKAFPEQLAYVKPWKPTRLFFNTSWFFYGSREEFEKADKSNLAQVDVGVYYPSRGKSNTEIAAESRSMHKSQGFGSSGTRGSEPDYLMILKGGMPKDKNNIFEGINTTWSRVPGGAPIGQLLAKVESSFRFDNPAASVPQLMQAYRSIEQLPDGYWKRVKMAEIKEVIRACLGLFQEVTAADFSASPGETISLRMESIQRGNIPTQLDKISILPMGLDTALNRTLDLNKGIIWSQKAALPQNLAYSSPYWLNDSWQLGLYTVKDQQLRGLPETPRVLKVRFFYRIAGVPITFDSDVVYKDTDPVDGEVYRPFEITPPVFTGLDSKAYVFASQQAQNVNVLVRAGRKSVNGTVYLNLPAGWKAEPASQEFRLTRKGEEQMLKFMVTPAAGQSDGRITPVAKVDGQEYNKSLVLVQYDHIPVQTVLADASSRGVRIDLKKEGARIGYIMGAGDDIPASLRQIGYDVALLGEKDLTAANLAQYDAVITGIRAYNTVEALQFRQAQLMEYVRQGGTLLVQYNNNFELKVPMEEMGPFPLTLSRDRVTVEDAEVRFLKPDHSVLKYPNVITQADFAGWEQERGLYFPNKWDPQYEAILSSNDPGEPARDGGLLVAKYGQGHYIYTGYSWFRQLPAGVPGAFRLFANLISIGKAPKP